MRSGKPALNKKLTEEGDILTMREKRNGSKELEAELVVLFKRPQSLEVEQKKSKGGAVSGINRRFRGRLVIALIALMGMLTGGGLLDAQGGDALFIDSSGHVGIGTDKPTATLEVKGQIKDENGFVIPRGMITMWSGTMTNIPPGWALCDGTNGTPDLRGRFIIVADDDKSPKANEYGEPDSHTHPISQQPLEFNTLDAGEHDHQTCTKYWYNNTTYGAGSGRTIVDRAGTDVHQERTSKAISHTHKVSADLRSQDTGVYNGPNRPRWYALCFIMKL